MSVTTVRLGQEIEENLDALAERLQRSRSWLINQALREFIERQELEQVRWNETLVAIASIAEGRLASGDSLRAWLRSWGSKDELAPPRPEQ